MLSRLKHIEKERITVEIEVGFYKKKILWYYLSIEMHIGICVVSFD